MDAAVAETVAKATRDQATEDARADLKELRRLAVEPGRERSRKITKTTRIDTRTGEIRYNPAGRLLRDWYLHVYLNTLRANLGEPAEPIDAQQVEDTAGILRRIRAGSEPVRALQAAGVIRNVAIDDAAHAAGEIVARARTVGTSRALLHAVDERFDGDAVRIRSPGTGTNAATTARSRSPPGRSSRSPASPTRRSTRSLVLCRPAESAV
jgi:hypothetical protein